MAFEDFISSIGSLFGGGGGGGGEPQAQPATNMMPGDMPTGRDAGGGNLLQSLILGVGPMVLSRLMGAGDQKNIDKTSQQLRRGARTASGAGQTMVDRASRGELTDPQKAAIEKMKREQNATMQQSFAKMGIPVSTMQAQATNQISQDAEAFAQKLINDSFEQGIKALGLGTTASQAYLSQAMSGKKELADTIGAVAKQIGMVMNQKPAPPTAEARVPTEWGGANEYGDVSTIGTEEGMGY